MHGSMSLASTINQFETLFHIGISHVKWLSEIISFKGVLTKCSLLVNVLFMMSNKWFLSKENMFKSPDTTFSDLIVGPLSGFLQLSGPSRKSLTSNNSLI